MLAGSSIGWREKLMRGIAGYSNEHGHWHVYTAPEGTEASLFFSESYQWDGLIVRVIDGKEARRIMKLGVPAVSVGSARVAASNLPRVKVDDSALTALAARHLISGGLRRFAYCSWFDRSGDDRGPAFAAHLERHGYGCDFYGDFSKLPATAPWQARQRDLAKWLAGLTKPVGTYNLIKLQYGDYAQIVRNVRAADRFRDKLGYLFGPPGWEPPGGHPTDPDLQPIRPAA